MIAKILTPLVIAMLLSTAMHATDIKGKINATNNKSKKPYALEGIKVDLYKSRSKEWSFIGSFKTNSEGMYYFKELKAGKYTIQVDGKTNYPLVILDRPKQEIAPIVVDFD